ncbi:hypothetical protein EV213_101263 [Aureibacillus halotolerans]|uniref:Uncharacterized protein n=1 Tax=Aureibacillus halotolerans TaxID=1508390 RepID=A0A4R6UI45_9BACI|nr:hypothetical protein EV213_101263 [Aureibacillus halotolerans]
MLFKAIKSVDQKSTSQAFFISWVTWGVLILINVSYEGFYETPLISSLLLFWSGLIVFFLSDFLLKIHARRRVKAH